MTSEVSRREFLKIGGTTAAGMIVLSGCTASLQQQARMEMYAKSPEQTLPGEDFWFASTCRMCPAGCGTIVRVSNGRARKIEGNPEHPLNQGRLCARGQAGLQMLYHPDRLQQVQVATGQRGQGQWRSADWQEIIDDIAATIQDTDPTRIAFLTGLVPQYQSELVSRFLKGLGASPAVIYDTQSAFDGRLVLEAASQELFGEPALPVFDIAEADVVFGFGANFLETWLSPVAYSKAYGAMRSRLAGRGTMIAFEPRLSMSASSADRWIPVKPGMEGLIALALGKIIVDQGLGHDASHTEHKALYDNVDVGAIAEAAEIAADDLVLFARIFADAHHALALPGGFTTGHTNGLDAAKAVLALNAVVGSTGSHGGMYLTPQAPSRDLRHQPVSSFADVQALVDRMSADDVELLFILDANPVYELPASLGFTKALEKVAKVITFSSMPTETTALSDIVLPAHTYLETWGYEFVNPGTEQMIVSSQQPVVQPVFDTREPGDVLMALAARLGGSVARRLPWPNMVNFVQTRLTSLQLEEGNFQAEDIDTFWAYWLQHGGWWSKSAAWVPPEPAEGFASPLSVTSPEFEGDPGQYPFYLIPIPSTAFGDGRHAGLPWLQEMPDPMTTASWDTWVEINPETADQLGIKNNDIVKIASPSGEIQAIAYVYPGIRPDAVAIPVGQGHTELGRWAGKRGANVLQILAPQTEPQTGQWAWAATRVNLARTENIRPLPLLESNLGVDRARQKGHFPG